MADRWRVSEVEAFANVAADSAARYRRCDDFAWAVRDADRAKESCDGFNLGAFPRRACAGVARSGECFLSRVSVHVGSQCRAEVVCATMELAAGAAEQMDLGRAAGRDSVS